jgi:hypothetical protein
LGSLRLRKIIIMSSRRRDIMLVNWILSMDFNANVLVLIVVIVLFLSWIKL